MVAGLVAAASSPLQAGTARPLGSGNGLPRLFGFVFLNCVNGSPRCSPRTGRGAGEPRRKIKHQETAGPPLNPAKGRRGEATTVGK